MEKNDIRVDQLDKVAGGTGVEHYSECPACGSKNIRLQKTEGINGFALAFQYLTKHGRHILVEIVVLVVYPFLHHTAGYLIVVVVKGKHLAAFLRNPEMDVGEQRRCLGRGKFLADFSKSALNLLRCLF